MNINYFNFHRLMMVLFAKDNSSIVLESISMDGRNNSRKVMHEDREISNTEALCLHYMRKTQLLCLLDREKNQIRYFTGSSTRGGYFVKLFAV